MTQTNPKITKWVSIINHIDNTLSEVELNNLSHILDRLTDKRVNFNISNSDPDYAFPIITSALVDLQSKVKGKCLLVDDSLVDDNIKHLPTGVYTIHQEIPIHLQRGFQLHNIETHGNDIKKFIVSTLLNLITEDKISHLIINDVRIIFTSDAFKSSLKLLVHYNLIYKLEEEPISKQVNFQECAQLEVDNNYQELRNKGEDALSLIFNMQKSIQEDVYGYNFEDIQSSIKKLKAYIDMNEEAIRDEDREMQSAITGIHTFPNCWKPWKSKHNEAMARPFSALTKDELKELHMEWIDKLHFFMSEAIALGLTPELITNYYVSKNLHNIERQKKIGGY